MFRQFPIRIYLLVPNYQQIYVKIDLGNLNSFLVNFINFIEVFTSNFVSKLTQTNGFKEQYEDPYFVNLKKVFKLFYGHRIFLNTFFYILDSTVILPGTYKKIHHPLTKAPICELPDLTVPKVKNSTVDLRGLKFRRKTCCLNVLLSELHIFGS